MALKMRFRLNYIITLLFSCFAIIYNTAAQISFTTIVPQQPVVQGESFRVQYVIENAENINGFVPPVFRNFTYITGPDIYSGSGLSKTKQVKNYAVTVAARTTGKFTIPGATAMIDGLQITSNNAIVTVISKTEALQLLKRNSEYAGYDGYHLKPGEDPYEKIKKNLFLKVLVDRTTSFIGQPVVATFKLYSRLESNSELIKNPGFYGFGVYDMINLEDNDKNNEIINGNNFDVHTLRKVQLYPLQPGVFILDAMELANKIKFSKTTVNKKTEQQVAEDMLGNNANEENENDGDAEVFETNLRTEPVTIKVKPLPPANSDTFNGAVGNFIITANIEKDNLAKNEEGFLIVTITGKGNFTQLAAPAVQWPTGFEGFDPVVLDTVDKMQVPLAGKRVFRYGFTCSQPGNYNLPAIVFIFFNPDNGKYSTVKTKSVSVTVTNQQLVAKKNTVTEETKPIKKSNTTYWLTGGALLLSLLIGSFYFYFKNSRSEKLQVAAITEEKNFPISIAEILQPAHVMLPAENKMFFSSLHQCIWNYLQLQFKLSGSEMNKERLMHLLKEKNIDTGVINDLSSVLSECEKGIYTDAGVAVDKRKLLESAGKVLTAISSNFFQQT
jgi:BatD DUF11 like domain